MGTPFRVPVAHFSTTPSRTLIADAREIRDTWGRITKSAKAKLRGEPLAEGEQTQDRDTIERWAKAEGADLENEAQRTQSRNL